MEANLAVQDPTGTGASNTGPGNAPEPGAPGLTGAGGGDNGGQTCASKCSTARPRTVMWVLVFFQLVNNNVTHYHLGQFLNQK